MKTKSLIILVAAAVISGSCTKLDTKPQDFAAPQYYFNTEEDINRALNGTYNVLNERLVYSGANGTLNTAFNASDEMFWTNATATSNPAIYNYTSTDALPNNIWAAAYRGIERANLVLANADKPAMDEAKRTIIKGEAKFLRAYFHFIVVQNFGDAPLRDAPTASLKDVFNKRIPAKEVYEFIYNEMVEAEGMVPEISAYSHAGRITKSAVQGMLARVSLFMAGNPNNIPGKYQDALFWAEKVINSGLHSLNPDYSNVFINLIQDKYDTRESIWEIEFFTTGAGEIYRNSGSLGVILGIRQNNSAYGVATPAFQAQEWFYKKFDDKDLRRNWNIAPYSYRGNNTNEKVYFTSAQIYNRFIGKFRREYELITNKSNTNGTNYPMLRYADVLLMAAEAENELNGPTPKALGYINEVRRRAYGAGKTIKSINVVNQGDGYPAATSVTVSVTGGGAANTQGVEPVSATPVVTAGKITAINIINRGTFYTGTPTVNIQSATGSGATATVTLTNTADADVPAANAADKATLRKFIQDERARELAFEGWRRLDLIRWGILQSTMQEVAAYIDATAPANFKYASAAGKNIQPKHDYFPIPEWEFSTNPEMYQNKDW